MNSIPTKIKVATLIGLATLIGIVVYVKADRPTADDSLDNAYNVRAVATTNLSAVMKTQARANEYTSAEYTKKMAPRASEASAYLALYEDYSHQDNTGGYARRTAPQTHPTSVKDKRASKPTNQSYEAYGVSAVVKKDTTNINSEEEEEEFEQPEDPRLQIETNVKQRVLGVDGYSNYSKDYSRVVRNAETNDDAYQVKETPSAYDAYKGYAVISANRVSANDSEGYTRRRAPEKGGTNVAPVRDQPKSKPTNETYEGYARVQVGEQTNNIAQYDNAKSNDKAYQAYGSSTSANSNKSVAYSEYSANKNTNQQAVASTDGYAKRRAPQEGTNSTPVRDISNTQQAQAEESYGGYAVRTPRKAKSKAASSYEQYAQQNTQSSNETYAGYAVRTPGKKNSNSSANLASNEDGYARKRAPQVAGGSSTSLAQYENASKNDYAYKSAPSTTTSEETYGGYAVRTPGKKKAQSANTATREYAQYDNKNSYGGQSIQGYGQYPTKTVQQNTRISKARGGVPASTGIKMYGNRGERLATTTSQLDRTVIVMPKRGRSVKGTVVQDHPGKDIIVQSSTGVQSTYKYGEIDAVVNI